MAVTSMKEILNEIINTDYGYAARGVGKEQKYTCDFDQSF